MVVQQQIYMQNLHINQWTVSAYCIKHSNCWLLLYQFDITQNGIFLDCKHTNVIFKYLEVTQRLVTQFDTVCNKGSATTYNQESLLLLPGQHDTVQEGVENVFHKKYLKSIVCFLLCLTESFPFRQFSPSWIIHSFLQNTSTNSQTHDHHLFITETQQ